MRDAISCYLSTRSATDRNSDRIFPFIMGLPWLRRCAPWLRKVSPRQLVGVGLVGGLVLVLLMLGDIRVAEAIFTRKLLDGGLLRFAKMLTTSQQFDLPEEGVFQHCPITLEVLRGYENRLAAFREARRPIERLIRRKFEELDADTRHRVKPYLPAISLEDHALMLLTVEELLKACKAAGLVVMAAKGSLLGAYRHHGMIPWDIDFDVFVNASQWRQTLRALSAVPGFALRATRSWLWKFNAHGNWSNCRDNVPYIDVSFFAEDASHVWSHTWLTLGFLMSPKSEVFPLQTWPFNGIEIPVPCNLQRAVRRVYNVDVCQMNFGPGSFILTDITQGQTRSERATFLSKVLPFVTRSELPGGLYHQEALCIGDVVIHNLTMPAPRRSCGRL